MVTEVKQILDELKTIKEELDYIKIHMVDIDTVLTPEEEERLEESLSDFKAKKTISLENFDKKGKTNVQSRAR